MVIVGDLTNQPGGPPSTPCTFTALCGSTVAAAPVHGDLFHPEVITCCPWTLLPAQSTAPTKLRTCLWLPSPVPVTPWCCDLPCPHNRACAQPSPHASSARRLSLPFSVPRTKPPHPP